jgi:hypothetical protein
LGNMALKTAMLSRLMTILIGCGCGAMTGGVSMVVSAS